MVNLNQFETDARIFLKKLTKGKLYFLKVDDSLETCVFEDVRFIRSPINYDVNFRMIFFTLGDKQPIVFNVNLNVPFITLEYLKDLFESNITLALDPSLYYI